MVKQPAAGRPRVLGDLEESVIARCCLALASFGYPATRDTIDVVIPCRDWKETISRWVARTEVFFFLKYWKELRERKPEHLAIQRATACTPAVIGNLFCLLKHLLKEEGILVV
jgi:hypothetical protein